MHQMHIICLSALETIRKFCKRTDENKITCNADQIDNDHLKDYTFTFETAV